MRGQVAKIGDTRISNNGYHYTKTSKAWRLTHHIIAEEELGRSIQGNERVVFKDGNRKNLDPNNIKVVVKGKQTHKKEKARLSARIQELQAALDLLEE